MRRFLRVLALIFALATGLSASTIFPSSSTPGATSLNAQSVELGVKLRSDAAGTITAIRFYKSVSDSGSAHAVSLWSSSGQLLATATSSTESAGGWQQVILAAPVSIAAGTTYIASYLASSAFVYDLGYFAQGIPQLGPVRALQNGDDGGNGVYLYGGRFPSSTYQATNYWVDVAFTADGEAPPQTARLLAIGDSITSQNQYGFMYWLQLLLKWFNVTFVGSQVQTADGMTWHHEGHPGWTACDLAAQTQYWAGLALPTIALIHAGTNDLYQHDNTVTIGCIAGIIDGLRAVNPEITIVLSKIIPETILQAQLQDLNDRIGTLAAQRNSPASKVIAIDQWTGFDPTIGKDTSDGTHPLLSGGLKMAAVLYAVLRSLLPLLS